MSDTAALSRGAAQPIRTTAHCRHCAAMASEIAGLFGHDHLGHRTVSALLRAGVDSRELLAQLTDSQLLGVRDVGNGAIERMRTILPSPTAATAEQRPAWRPRPFDRRAHFSLAALLDRLPEDLRATIKPPIASNIAAPLWLLTAFSSTDPRIWRHVDRSRIRFPAILCENGWSLPDRALLAAARYLNGATTTRPDALLLAEALDDECWEAFLEALRIRRTGLRGGD